MECFCIYYTCINCVTLKHYFPVQVAAEGWEGINGFCWLDHSGPQSFVVGFSVQKNVSLLIYYGNIKVVSRPSGPCAISHGLGHSFVWMVPITLQSMSNVYYAESIDKYPLIETNAAATATRDSMRHNDSYSQVEISHPLPVIQENSYAVISTRLEAVYTLMLLTS